MVSMCKYYSVVERPQTIPLRAPVRHGYCRAKWLHMGGGRKSPVDWSGFLSLEGVRVEYKD